MQIKIEIDVKPEELRRFLGLPDVAGLQDDVVRFLREKIGAASESFDPATVVTASFDLIKRTPAWRVLRAAMGPRQANGEAADVSQLLEEVEEAEEVAQPRRRPRAKRRPKRAAEQPKAARKRARKRPAPDTEAPARSR